MNLYHISTASFPGEPLSPDSFPEQSFRTATLSAPSWLQTQGFPGRVLQVLPTAIAIVVGEVFEKTGTLQFVLYTKVPCAWSQQASNKPGIFPVFQENGRSKILLVKDL